MEITGTGDLKHDPQTVIQRVLESRDEFEITACGKPTGVRIVRDNLGKRRWIPGPIS